MALKMFHHSFPRFYKYLPNILPKQSTTIHDRKESSRVMFHELLPHSSIGETFIPISINTRNHDKLSNVACEYASTN